RSYRRVGRTLSVMGNSCTHDACVADSARPTRSKGLTANRVSTEFIRSRRGMPVDIHAGPARPERLSWASLRTLIQSMADSPQQHDLASLAERFGLELRGDGHGVIRGVGTLAGAAGDQLAFLANSRYTPQLADTAAGAVVLAADQAEACPGPALVASDPNDAYAKVAALVQRRPAPSAS